MYSATYSPDDNKLRFYSVSRLPRDIYERVKAAGFRWAPKQELFFAPAWTPAREDLLLELCGEIGDEDKSLCDRAEERADRFGDYSDKRAADADRARAAVAAIADNIPMGQPILVGHHSEKRARRDAERIENGMRRAVKAWETSEYWTRRAAGALRHAKYKERPDVRARRIKTIEADKRKEDRTKAKAADMLKAYTSPEAAKVTLRDGRPLVRALLESFGGGLTYEAQRALERGELSFDIALADAVRCKRATIANCDRWIAHFDNRLAYERALLDEQGGADLLKPKPKKKQLPLCNYRAPEGLKAPNRYHAGEMIHYAQVEMTQAEYAKIWRDYKATREIDGTHRVRTAMIRHALCCVFLTDYKETQPPAAPGAEELKAKADAREAALIADATAKAQAQLAARQAREETRAVEKEKAAPFDAMRDQLRAGGVQVVTAPQLFPTPPALARRMVEIAEFSPFQRVLEPSAGTGALVEAINKGQWNVHLVANEINRTLCDQLAARWPIGIKTLLCSDFLNMHVDESGAFDRVLMNPPFSNADDIKHIQHARGMLKPGGRLVAICANGPRQRAALQPIAAHWEDLPPGTFAESGTNVNAALLVIEA